MKCWTEGQWHVGKGKCGHILPGKEAGHPLVLFLVIIYLFVFLRLSRLVMEKWKFCVVCTAGLSRNLPLESTMVRNVLKCTWHVSPNSRQINYFMEHHTLFTLVLECETTP